MCTATAGLSSHASLDRLRNAANKLACAFLVITRSIPSMHGYLAVCFMSPYVSTVPSFTCSNMKQSQQAMAHLVAYQMSKCSMSHSITGLVCGDCV